MLRIASQFLEELNISGVYCNTIYDFHYGQVPTFAILRKILDNPVDHFEFMNRRQRLINSLPDVRPMRPLKSRRVLKIVEVKDAGTQTCQAEVKDAETQTRLALPKSVWERE